MAGESKPKRLPVKQLERPAHEPAPISLFIATAARAMVAGQASEHQQKELVKWLVFQACGKALPAYQQSDRDTAFMLGRHFVADQLNGLLTVDLDTLRRAS
jgi:hypothetical protein